MKLVGNVLYSLTGTAAPAILSIVTVPFYIAQIGADRYGTLAIAWVLLGYFGAADFGIGRAITQRISTLRQADTQERVNAVWSALTVMVGFGVIITAVVYFFAKWYFAGPFDVDSEIRREAGSAVLTLALCTPVVAIGGVLSGSLMGLERFRAVSFATLIGNLGVLLLPLAASYLISVEISVLVLASLLARLVGVIVLAINVWATFFRTSLPSFSRADVKALFNFGGWVMVSALMGPLMLIADRFAIGIMRDAAAVAAFTIPFQVANRTLLFPIAVGQALFPRFASQGDVESRSDCLQYACFLGQIFAPVIVALICLAKPLLELWLGNQLDPRSISVAHIVLAGCWVNAIAVVPFAFVQARGNPRFTALLHTAELPIFIVAMVILGWNFGLSGFAAAFALRCLIDCLILLRKAGFSHRAAFTGLAVPALLVILALSVGTLVTDLRVLLAFAAALFLLTSTTAWLQLPDQVWQRVQSHPLTAKICALSSRQ
ncbi:flippase [Erythrobacter alti]|uniref:flippase n=1 Tax=Erythrobacter alti TaxID=1896145 RepID=UPI0030F42664